MILIVVYFENSFMFPALVLKVLFLTSTIAHTLVYAVMYHEATKVEEYKNESFFHSVKAPTMFCLLSLICMGAQILGD